MDEEALYMLIANKMRVLAYNDNIIALQLQIHVGLLSLRQVHTQT